jgi:hypothetical protein
MTKQHKRTIGLNTWKADKKVEMESSKIIHYVKQGFICDADIEISE